MKVQNTRSIPLRAAAILTNSYVIGSAGSPTGSASGLDFGECNQLLFLVNFTLGSLTTGQFKVEFSPDNVNWFGETQGNGASGAVVAGEYTLPTYQRAYTFAQSGNYLVPVPGQARYVRVQAIGNGTLTGSSMAITCMGGVR